MGDSVVFTGWREELDTPPRHQILETGQAYDKYPQWLKMYIRKGDLDVKIPFDDKLYVRTWKGTWASIKAGDVIITSNDGLDILLRN